MDNNTRVKTGEVRFSYCHIFEPYAFDETQEAKYSLSILIDKQDKTTITAIQNAYNAAVEQGKEKYGKSFESKALSKCPMIRPVGSNYGLLKDADADPDTSGDPNLAGHYIMNLKTNRAPQVLARETGRQKITKENGGEDIVYSGCYGKVTLSVYPYNNISTGISASLNNVLKTRDGDKFSGMKSAEDDFADDLSSDENDDDLLG